MSSVEALCCTRKHTHTLAHTHVHTHTQAGSAAEGSAHSQLFKCDPVAATVMGEGGAGRAAAVAGDAGAAERARTAGGTAGVAEAAGALCAFINIS